MLKRLGFEIKDIITAIIAFAALTTSITSLWAGYLRKARLRLTLPDRLSLGYGQDLRLHVRADIAISNLGARPGVLTAMRLELIRGNEIVSLKWYEVLETKNIAEKGQPRKLWTDFVAFSCPIVVSKYDAKLVQAGFGTQSKLDLTATRYQVRLVAFHADGKEALYSEERAIDLREDGLNFLKQNCITDQTGVRKAHLGLFFADGAYSAEAATLQDPAH